MAISYIYLGEPMSGTAGDDFMFGYLGSTGTDNNTINGNGGDDLVIGDSTNLLIPDASSTNGSIANAYSLELPNAWTTSENQMFGDSSVPHMTAVVESTIGQSEFFSVTIGAGQQIIVDLDFAWNTAIGSPRDLVVELQDGAGNILASDDDSLLTEGGQGSFPISPGSASSRDPYLVFTAPSAGTYYINVRPFGSATFTENNTFVLNVSVAGHAVAANAAPGTDTINGGEGDDALFGQGGADVINGDGGNDLIDSGSGVDIVNGGEGNDTIHGGDATEETIHGDNGNDILYSGGEGHYFGDAGNDIVYAGLTGVVNEVLDGGADIDTVDTTTWNSTYVVNLATGATNFNESFLNFENIVSGNGNDTVTGTGVANAITTQGGNDVVNAGAGNDTVSGGDGNDTLDGEADDDTLSGGLNDDMLIGGLGADAMDGGDGFDYVRYDTPGAAGLTVALFAPVLNTGAAAGDTYTGIEGLILTNNPDVGYGSNNADYVYGQGGNDSVYGQGGNDNLFGGAANDLLWGGLGADFHDGGDGFDYVRYDDAAFPGMVAALFAPGLNTGAAAGDTYANVEGLIMGMFNDTGYGSNSADYIYGINGNDLLYGQGGNDNVYGGDGNDLLWGGLGADVLDGGTGFDYARYDDATFPSLVASLSSPGINTGAAAGDTYFDLEGLILGFFDDTGYGSGNADYLYGINGNDTLYGLGGADNLYGGSGADTLVGGDGSDLLSGDVGGDAFRFDAALNAATNLDTIVDFALGDKIHLENGIFTSLAATGVLAAGHFRSGAGVTAAADADDYIIYNTTDGALYYDVDGSGAAAAVQFATLSNMASLTWSDIVVT